MVYIYVLINLAYIAFSRWLYRATVNPISLYSIMWTTMVVLYELKLVYYYDLTTTTWIIIIVFQLVYNIGCILGKRNPGCTYQTDNEQFVTGVSVGSKKDLRTAIVILCLLASISVVSKLMIAIRAYGFNLVAYTNQLYADRLAGNIRSGIPYLDCLLYPALVYSGVYFTKFGFNNVILLPTILVVADELTSGGRLRFVCGVFMLLAPVVFQRGNRITSVTVDSRPRKEAGENLKLLMAATVAIAALAIVTRQRSSYIAYHPYMSPLMARLSAIRPSLYKNYTYFASPLGVLNEFLKEPTFRFGGHTFLTVYNFLNKFGANMEVSQAQTFFYVPISCNVGTYIRALIEDFTVPVALVIAFITGFVFSYNYYVFRKRGTYLSAVWASTFGFVVFFSFFTWHFRSSSMWITLFSGTVLGYILDGRNRKRARKLKRRVTQVYVEETNV